MPALERHTRYLRCDQQGAAEVTMTFSTCFSGSARVTKQKPKCTDTEF